MRYNEPEQNAIKIYEGQFSMEKLSLPEKDRLCKISFLRQMSVSETYHIHTHDFYEIFYVVKGRAMHCINGAAECLTAGTAQLIRPSDCHEYSFINRYDMELISIGIERCVMEEILNFTEISADEIDNAEMPLRIVYDSLGSEKVSDELIKISRISDSEKRRSYAKTIIAQLVFDMTESKTETNKIPYWLDALVSEMAKRENYLTGLPRMLELSHVSQHHLNREMKKSLGMTPTEFINAKRIAYAAELLLEDKHSIVEIVGMCGFETTSNFYSNFQKFYGCNPKAFIKQHDVNIQ